MAGGDRDDNPIRVTPIRGTLAHGTAVALAIDPDGPLCGVLLTGQSGSGKSDLALRLMEACPWRRTRLIADDCVLIRMAAGHVLASAPQTIAGQMEVRGVGIMPVPSLHDIRLKLVITLSRETPRLPEADTIVLAGTGGVALPCRVLDPFELSAPEKLRYAARSIVAGLLPEGRQDKPLD